MDELLKILNKNGAHTPAEIAAMLNMTEAEVIEKIKRYREKGIILGFQAILNEEKLGIEPVRALIEVKVTPEREGGFDRIAERIAKFDEVKSCLLMSGSYDLLVVVEGSKLRDVAGFVSEKLATIDGVISTATHFILKPYKQSGVLMKAEHDTNHLPVTP
jgi:DNA-binding Lrp family transcriptional regulator